MADIKTLEERSKNMAAIKNKDTRPEMFFRKLMFARGFRYRKNYSALPGCPDLWLRRYNLAVFVNGCFWHRHSSCKYAYMPKSRALFWEQKFRDTVARDVRIIGELTARGIKCLVVWECTIKKMKRSREYESEVFDSIQLFLKTTDLFMEV